MTSSARNGSVNTTAHGMTPAFMRAAVAAAHQHGKKILLSVGGAEDLNWDAACNSTNRATFVNNLVALMKLYGYDGLDLDVEQDFGAPAHTDFIACVSGIRAALNAITPRPMLTEAADPSWQGYMIAPVAQYLDQINFMSYWGAVTKMPAEVANYTSRGVPVSKLAIGLGLVAGMIDTSLASCQAKTAYAANNGLGGVMEWVVTAPGVAPCMAVVGTYLAGTTPPPTPAPTATPRPTPTATPRATPRPTQGTSGVTSKATSTPNSAPSGPVALRPSTPGSTENAADGLSPPNPAGPPYLLLGFLAVLLAGGLYLVWRLR